MRELIRQCEIKIGEESTLELRYYLLSQEADCNFSCEAPEGMLYGVALCAIVSSKGAELLTPHYTEVSEVGFSYLKSESLDFINEIADACVTPESFIHIIDEYIGIF